jgi:phenylpropionate dioxygenase-like ring-hydroxylating dioxygenase large terminal subunit
MTTREENDILTRTGPGTPMGALFRRYWIPFLLAEELPEPDSPPVRVQLLSERLIAFRDTGGRIGLIDEFCAHRRVSLWFGRNEAHGLRCPYHGWKYDVTGQCTEVPSERSAAFCERIRLTSYPCRELGGVIWAYMGPPELMPPAPDFEWMEVPAAQRYVNKRIQESNYLQSLEGGIDGAHVSWLHRGALAHEPMRRGSQGASYQNDARPRMEVMECATGLTIGARRAADGQSYYWRLTQWIMPWYNMIPPYGDHALHGHAWVPINDETCLVWTFTHHPTRALSAEEHAAMQSGEGIYATLIPGTYRPVAQRANDYLMDREAQRAGRYYSGIPGIAMQDASLQESCGPIVDRSLERLASTDAGIVMARARLLRAARGLDHGERPPALDPAEHRVRSASFVRPASVSFSDVVKEVSGIEARAGVSHLSI